jgi:hypothetical protein
MLRLAQWAALAFPTLMSGNWNAIALLYVSSAAVYCCLVCTSIDFRSLTGMAREQLKAQSEKHARSYRVVLRVRGSALLLCGCMFASGVGTARCDATRRRTGSRCQQHGAKSLARLGPEHN